MGLWWKLVKNYPRILDYWWNIPASSRFGYRLHPRVYNWGELPCLRFVRSTGNSWVSEEPSKHHRKMGWRRWTLHEHMDIKKHETNRFLSPLSNWLRNAAFYNDNKTSSQNKYSELISAISKNWSWKSTVIFNSKDWIITILNIKIH